MDTATKITLSFGLGFIGYQRGETTGIVFGTMEEAQAGLGGELISDAVLGINGDSLVLETKFDATYKAGLETSVERIGLGTSLGWGTLTGGYGVTVTVHSIASPVQMG